MAKTSTLKQFSTAYSIASLTSVTTATAAVWLANEVGYSLDYSPTVVATWLAITGLPSTLYAGQQLYKILGYRPATTASASRVRQVETRSIPIHGGKSGFIFLNGFKSIFQESIPAHPATPRATPPPLPDIFTVHNVSWGDGMEPLTVSFTETEVLNWLMAVWRRQTSDKASYRRYPMSRNYFTSSWRPRLDFSEYYGLISLCDMAGLLTNRTQGKSGKLVIQPSRAIRQIKYTFA